MAIIRLAIQSLRNRKFTAILTVLTIAICVILLLGVERLRTQAKTSFADTVSGTDLIVGARSGQINLLLYSIFRIGHATNNIDWKSVEDIKKHRAVSWSIPISLGDSHRGFRVIGTTNDYFNFYQYGHKQALNFAQGVPFQHLFNTVIGAEVAKKLNYQLGDEIFIAHGLVDKNFTRHDHLPFTVTGILSPTGTPVDRSIHVSLAALEAVHLNWQTGTHLNHAITAEQLSPELLKPKQITALLLGLNSRIQTFAVQRYINQYQAEPLSAILPSVALHELWSMMSIAEQTLLIVSGFVLIAGLMGLLSSLLTSLNERRREMAILRAMGARPYHIFLLLISEAFLLTVAGIILGVTLLLSFIHILAPFVLSEYGLQISAEILTPHEFTLLGTILLSSIIMSAFPAFRAYRQSLADGMMIRV